MKVTLVGATRLTGLPQRVQDTQYETDVLFSEGTDSAMDLMELAGRTCYLSYDKPNPETATVDGYLTNIISQQHYSVLEHGSVSFFVEGVSRSFLAEITRHRHLSFSVQSQRFVNEGYSFVMPPALRDDEEGQRLLREGYALAYDAYITLKDHLKSKGWSRKQANEAARSLLPNCQAVTMVVTGNHRAWREVIAKRDNPHADAEIQEFASRVKEILMESFAPLYRDL